MKTLRLVIEGRVQGVWFRESMRREAQRLAVAGWVRNCADGSVEAVAQGTDDAVNALVEWSRRGPPQARVTRVEIEEISDGHYTAFDKRSDRTERGAPRAKKSPTRGSRAEYPPKEEDWRRQHRVPLRRPLCY